MKPGFLFRFQHSEGSGIVRMKMHEDITLNALLDNINQFLLAVGYSPGVIARDVGEWAAELEAETTEKAAPDKGDGA